MLHNVEKFDPTKDWVGVLVDSSSLLAALRNIRDKGTELRSESIGRGMYTIKCSGITLAVCSLTQSSWRHASSVAAQMRTDFPKIKLIASLGLTYGYIENEPSDAELQLGDVVISGNKGVVLASQITGKFLHEHSAGLHPPGKTLLNAAKCIEQASATSGLHPIVEATEQIISQFPESKQSGWQKPKSSGSTRNPRVFESVIPTLEEYGLNFAAIHKLCKENDALCVDQVAAGVAQSDIEYIIIRGIHKQTNNKKVDPNWANYACCTAAGYLKCVLAQLSPAPKLEDKKQEEKKKDIAHDRIVIDERKPGSDAKAPAPVVVAPQRPSVPVVVAPERGPVPVFVVAPERKPVPAVAPERKLPAEEEAFLKACSKYTKQYIENFRGKKTHTQIVEEMKLTKEEDDLLESVRDSITAEVMNRPVTVNEQIYDLDTVLKFKGIDPARNEFEARDVTASRATVSAFEEIIKRIEAKRKSAKKEEVFPGAPGGPAMDVSEDKGSPVAPSASAIKATKVEPLPGPPGGPAMDVSEDKGLPVAPIASAIKATKVEPFPGAPGGPGFSTALVSPAGGPSLFAMTPKKEEKDLPDDAPSAQRSSWYNSMLRKITG